MILYLKQLRHPAHLEHSEGECEVGSDEGVCDGAVDGGGEEAEPVVQVVGARHPVSLLIVVQWWVLSLEELGLHPNWSSNSLCN